MNVVEEGQIQQQWLWHGHQHPAGRHKTPLAQFFGPVTLSLQTPGRGSQQATPKYDTRESFISLNKDWTEEEV